MRNDGEPAFRTNCLMTVWPELFVTERSPPWHGWLRSRVAGAQPVGMG